MKKAVFLCSAMAALCLLSACNRQSPHPAPAPEEAPPVARAITPEEGAAILEELLGTVDTVTGNLMSYGYENALTIEGVRYYNYRVSWLVDNNHFSYLTNYLVSADGSLVKEYIPDADTELQGAADAVLQRMQAGDFAALAQWVDSEAGVTLTPYSTVDFTADRRLTAEELAALDEDREVYCWGSYDGSGAPITLSKADYWKRFVWDTDYTAAPDVQVRRIAQQGNSPENVDTAYPYQPAEGASYSYVEYHFDGLDPQYGGADWRALKLVFVQREDAWQLVGLIHSEMTV